VQQKVCRAINNNNSADDDDDDDDDDDNDKNKNKNNMSINTVSHFQRMAYFDVFKANLWRSEKTYLARSLKICDLHIALLW
jgi:hypothetical protein